MWPSVLTEALKRRPSVEPLASTHAGEVDECSGLEPPTKAKSPAEMIAYGAVTTGPAVHVVPCLSADTAFSVVVAEMTMGAVYAVPTASGTGSTGEEPLVYQTWP